MRFENKTDGYKPKYIIKNTDTGEEHVVTISQLLSESQESGTRITAETLNAAFDSKQDKLIAGDGIVLTTGNNNDAVYLNTDNIMCNYKMVTHKLIGVGLGASATEDDLKKWKFVQPEQNSFIVGRHYLSAINGPKMYYTAAEVNMDVENISYSESIDAYPSIVVKFRDSDNDDVTLYCLFRFLQGRLAIVKNEQWLTVGSQNGLQYPHTANGDYEKMNIRVVRYKSGTDSYYTYNFFLNGSKIYTWKDTNKLTVRSSVQIGTIGCKATFCNWKVIGNH